MGCWGTNMAGWGGWWSPLSGLFYLLILGLLIYFGILLIRRGRFTEPFGQGLNSRNQLCPSCGGVVLDTYLCCPECHYRVKRNCPSCGRIVKSNWAVCPFCEADLADTKKEGGKND